MFQLKHSNRYGTFELILERDIEKDEMIEVCHIANNFLSSKQEKHSPVFCGPLPPAQTIGPTIQQQTRLGEHPVDSINMGSYVEPEDGVRLKMLSMVELGRVPAFKILRETTGLSVKACKEIIFGNYLCPILTIEVARIVLEKFRELNIFAKIVPAFTDDQSQESSA